MPTCQYRNLHGMHWRMIRQQHKQTSQSVNINAPRLSTKIRPKTGPKQLQTTATVPLLQFYQHCPPHSNLITAAQRNTQNNIWRKRASFVSSFGAGLPGISAVVMTSMWKSLYTSFTTTIMPGKIRKERYTFKTEKIVGHTSVCSAWGKHTS